MHLCIFICRFNWRRTYVIFLSVYVNVYVFMCINVSWYVGVFREKWRSLTSWGGSLRQEWVSKENQGGDVDITMTSTRYMDASSGPDAYHRSTSYGNNQDKSDNNKYVDWRLMPHLLSSSLLYYLLVNYKGGIVPSPFRGVSHKGFGPLWSQSMKHLFMERFNEG
mgnify:CR=1 FL=1